MFIPTPISKIVLALLIPISVVTALRAPANSAKRQLKFATTGVFVFFLGILFIPDSNWPVQLVLYAFGLGATIALWRAIKRHRRERRELST